MAYIRYDKLCRNAFYNNVSAKKKGKDLNPSQLKPKAKDSYEKDAKITTT